MESEKSAQIKPRIIIHGGAGNITRENLPAESYKVYRSALISILHDAHEKLRLPNARAIDIATEAVSHLEDNGLFNAGHGAVFTSAGTHELEASVMVSRGFRKRGVGVMKVRKAKNPIKLAREMLIRGEEKDGGGAGMHCQLEGETCDRLVEEWGLENVKPSYFWTRKRWDQHRRGLGKSYDDDTYERKRRQADEEELGKGQELKKFSSGGQSGVSETSHATSERIVDGGSWDAKEYLPQGTVGAVVLDSTGTICVATSTGGMTNKLLGRIGDTPTIGAGFFAEEWQSTHTSLVETDAQSVPTVASLAAAFKDCLGYRAPMPLDRSTSQHRVKQVSRVRAVGMSGTGNGDSFLRLSAVRTAAAIARFSGSHPAQTSPVQSLVCLQDAISAVAGPDGMLQQSAEDRWPQTGEGEAGIIGIELNGDKGSIALDFNCGGMFHAWIDDDGRGRFGVFNDDV